MKKIYTLILLVALAASAQADVIKAIRNNSNWNSSTTWDLNRSPLDNDTVVISLGYKVTITSNITLNNMRIKIAGILDLTNNGKLDLNSASRIDVLVGGLITGDGSNDQIRIGNTHVFKGSWPNVVGPMFADNTTGGGFLPFSVLPVKFVNFYVSKYNNDVRLNWSTANETNNNHFEIERSLDGSNWSTIAMVLGAMNSTSVTSYSYTDKNMTAKQAYYRIKQVDNDGKFTYTAIKSVRNEEVKSGTQIYASSNSIVVKFEQPKQNVTVKVIGLNGQVFSQQVVNEKATMFSVNAGIKNKGVYVVQVIDAENNFDTKKILF